MKNRIVCIAALWLQMALGHAQVLQDSVAVSQQEEIEYSTGNVVEDYERQQADSIRKAEEELEAEVRAWQEENERRIAEMNARKKDRPMFDVQTKILDGRHYYRGDTFEKGLFDHVGVSVGAGVEQIMEVNKKFHINPLTMAHLGVVKEFDPRHSLRLMASYGFGYQRDKDIEFRQLIGKLDYMFNLSSYFDGYKPDRLLNFSTVLGVGYQTSTFGASVKKKASALEAHAGLQLKFYAGPKASLTLEPIIKIAEDSYDQSADLNWKKYDIAYGANMYFTYYFNSNLSKRKNAGEFRIDYDDDKLKKEENGRIVELEGRELYEAKMEQVNDLARQDEEERRRVFADDESAGSWRTPFFVDFSSGINMVKLEQFGLMDTRGASHGISVGKWFSSAIGLRATGFFSSYKWKETVIPATELTPAYHKSWNGAYAGGNVEGVVNLLGMRRNYDWQSPVGLNLLLGMGVGRMTKIEEGSQLRCGYVAYTGGAQLWMRLSDDLRLFVEPNYTRYSYKIPYSNVDWNKQFSDEAISVRLGLTMMMNTVEHKREKEKAYGSDEVQEKRVYAGIGGGINSLFYKGNYKNGSNMNVNGMLYAGYKFNKLHGVQLGFQYTVNSESQLVEYQDRNPEYGFISTRTGLWKRTFFVGMTSFDYALSLSSLFSGYVPQQRWELDLLAGPAVALRFGEKDKFATIEHATGGNERAVKNQADFSAYFGLNGGLNLKCRVSPRLSAFMLPSFYYFPTNEVFDRELFMSNTLMFSLNLGVQYVF